MVNASAEFSVWQGIAQFFSYAILAIFAENVIFARGLGVSRLIKLVGDPEVKTWQYCTPVILVQLLGAPAGWWAHTVLFPFLRNYCNSQMIAALRPLVYLSCSALAMGVVWFLVGLAPADWRDAFREQLPLATCNCCALGTLLICANQNYTLLQYIAFGLGSGIGYLLAVLIVDEGRRRLSSKDVPQSFRGLPSYLVYIGVLSLALFGLVGHGVA